MAQDSDPASQQPASLEAHDGEVRCTGPWTLAGVEALQRQVDSFAWPAADPLVMSGAHVSAMDTAGAWLMYRTVRALQEKGRRVELRALRPDHMALLEMVRAQRQKLETESPPAAPGMLETLGRAAVGHLEQGYDLLAFLGETALAMARVLGNPARLRLRATLRNLEAAGFDALPIVGLLSFLMGVVIAYQGGEQLRAYGANIFIVDLVGITLLRELSPLLTAIIVAGRTGSAYTAEIGTMKVTEEIDALRTIGIAPLELLVLPKLLALIVALPLLSVFADALGVLGGMVMADLILGVSYTDFLQRFPQAVGMPAFIIGIGKAPVFAAVIAVVGCFQGLRVSGSADSVGAQVTVSVVQAIFLVIVTDAVFSIIFSWLGV